MIRFALLAASLVLAGAAASCGHRGSLERPDPMWGGDRERAGPAIDVPDARDEDDDSNPSARQPSPR